MYAGQFHLEGVEGKWTFYASNFLIDFVGKRKKKWHRGKDKVYLRARNQGLQGFTLGQIRSKMYRLLRCYSRVKRHNERQTGGKRIKWAFFDKMDGCFRYERSLFPVKIIESNGDVEEVAENDTAVRSATKKSKKEVEAGSIAASLAEKVQVERLKEERKMIEAKAKLLQVENKGKERERRLALAEREMALKEKEFNLTYGLSH